MSSERQAASAGHRSGHDAVEPHIPADATSAGPLPAREGAPAGFASAAIVAGFVALVACLLLLGTIAEDLRSKELVALDAAASPFLHALASPWLDAVMNAATFIGSSSVVVPAFVLATVLLLARRRLGSALFLTVASGGSLLLNELMKLAFHRPRPSLPWSSVLPDYSFPSGHTMNSLAFFVAVGVVIWSLRGPRAGVPAVLGAIALAVVIGVSRIYLGYHYLTDVVGGLLAGASWLLLVLGAFRIRAAGSSWRRPAGQAVTPSDARRADG